jgi:2-desacetyl-2-hydroxyethyl bacteriochlorophyllide A dehydrogenase
MTSDFYRYYGKKEQWRGWEEPHAKLMISQPLMNIRRKQGVQSMSDLTHSVILEKPGSLAVKPVPMPQVPDPGVLVEMRACGICGSDVRYYYGDNPWALHTLGENKKSPENMILGHEVAGVVKKEGKERRVGVLAYKGCGKCHYCLTDRENLCGDVQHIGHSTGWGSLPCYPGGMSERFLVWEGFDYDLPESVSFEEAVFLDGLAVAVHAVEQAGLREGDRFGILGLGPIGMLCAQVATHRGAELVCGCDTYELPMQLAEMVGLTDMLLADAVGFARRLRQKNQALDAVIDTVGTPETIAAGLSILDKSGSLVLVSVQADLFEFSSVSLSGERRIVSAANNRYKDFPEAIDLLASGVVKVKPLITHRFPLSEAKEAFDIMIHKENVSAFKIVLHP